MLYAEQLQRMTLQVPPGKCCEKHAVHAWLLLVSGAQAFAKAEHAQRRCRHHGRRANVVQFQPQLRPP